MREEKIKKRIQGPPRARQRARPGYARLDPIAVDVARRCAGAPGREAAIKPAALRLGARRQRRASSDAGFTLLELLVVLAILGLLAAIIGPQVIRYLGSSRSQTAHVQAKNVEAALELFKLDAGRYPTPDEGLGALVKAPPTDPAWNGPYLTDPSALNDPWGKPYMFKVPGDHGEVDVYSYGSDGAPGGSGEAKDVGNW